MIVGFVLYYMCASWRKFNIHILFSYHYFVWKITVFWSYLHFDVHSWRSKKQAARFLICLRKSNYHVPSQTQSSLNVQTWDVRINDKPTVHVFRFKISWILKQRSEQWTETEKQEGWAYQVDSCSIKQLCQAHTAIDIFHLWLLCERAGSRFGNGLAETNSSINIITLGSSTSRKSALLFILLAYSHQS